MIVWYFFIFKLYVNLDILRSVYYITAAFSTQHPSNNSSCHFKHAPVAFLRLVCAPPPPWFPLATFEPALQHTT